MWPSVRCAPETMCLNTPRAGLLCLPPVPHRPWSDISLDFVTGLSPSEGNTTFLTVVDRFSKMVHFIPLSKLPSTKETTEVMLRHVFRLRGFPKDVASDRGLQFELRFCNAFLLHLGRYGQPYVGVPSPVQWPDRAFKPGAGDGSMLPGIPKSPKSGTDILSGWSMHTTHCPVLPLVSLPSSVPMGTNRCSFQPQRRRTVCHQPGPSFIIEFWANGVVVG